MEATAGRGGPMAMATQQSRKEWRAVSEHHSARNVGDEELDRSKLGQSDERTIYEHGREPRDVDFCSINIDGSLDNDLLQRRLHDVSRQRQEMQHVEIDLRAQVIARSELIEMQHNFDAQMEERVKAAAKLQEQLHERDQTIHELEMKLEDRDRELHSIKLDNEASWAKEDLLREQNNEIASLRRELDHSEADRSQHIKKLHELQEHIQEKERQLMELQEQHGAVQENVLYKDERLREAQAWISRVQEMDALQSTTLQAELRERTEQYNQLWLGCQRQFAEMERVHLYTVQKLQHELAETKENSGTFKEESRIPQENLKDVSQYGQKNDGNQLDIDGSVAARLPNGNTDNVTSFVSSGSQSTQIEHSSGVAIPPSSIIGMPSYLGPAQLTSLHPFVMHHQVPQPHVGQFQSVPPMSSLQQWQNQQVGREGLQRATQTENTSSQADEGLLRSNENYGRPEFLNTHMGHGSDPNSGISSSAGEAQAIGSVDRGYLVPSRTEQELKQISSQFQNVLGLALHPKNNESEAKEQTAVATEGSLSTEQLSSAATSQDDASTHTVNFDKSAIENVTTPEIPLLDERSLLACIVRTIPAGGRIRISSTLPNRLGKMLAPLHWHDYKKRYGKLDDFLASHPELFVIEGDHIQLREGAQKMVAANAAVAKVAAAAAAPPSYSSSLPSVAVTPMAQNRLKKNQQPNGVYYGGPKGSAKFPSKPSESSVIQNSGSINGRSNSSNSGARPTTRTQGRRYHPEDGKYS